MNTGPLGRISNDELLRALDKLVATSRKVDADLLAHLAEVDARRLYLSEGCSSMFRYCTEVLHYSEATAFHRIHVARAARKFPSLLDHVRQGRIHLAGLSLLAPHLTRENHVELLDLACHRSKRAIEKLLAERSPKPDVPAVVRKLPETSAVSTRPDTAHLCKSVEQPALDRAPSAQAASLPARRSQNSAPEPLGRRRYKIQFTASQELLRHQLPGGDVAQVLERALTLLLAETRRRKFAETSRPRSPARDRSSVASRHIPAAVKRAVVSRDGGRCTFLGRNGRRCDSADFVEYHHLDPWASSRYHSVEGIELRCRAHNQYAVDREVPLPPGEAG